MTVRKTVLALLLTAATLVLGGGIALAQDIACGGGPCEGTETSDSINGSFLPDVIFAKGGFDFAGGFGGDDEVHGGASGDQLTGGEGDDRVFGEGGRDKMSGNLGNDQLFGGAEADFMTGDDGDDVLRGGAGSESSGVNAGLFGGAGDDRVFGGPGDDGMHGNEGSDRLFGEDGDDRIDAVTLETPGSRDTVECGPGFDRVVANANDVVADDCEQVRRVANAQRPSAEAIRAAEAERARLGEAFLARQRAAEE